MPTLETTAGGPATAPCSTESRRSSQGLRRKEGFRGGWRPVWWARGLLDVAARAPHARGDSAVKIHRRSMALFLVAALSFLPGRAWADGNTTPTADERKVDA